MEPYQIIGIMLIKDEDLYIGRVIRNIIDFCDELIVAENYSEDRTYEIVSSLARQYPKITMHRISHVKESHTLIEKFAGSDTWIFGVDGDEIYDPAGLAKMRQQLQQGAFDDQWVIFGNVLHCTHLDLKCETATGFLAPPSRSMTKLYNFSLIESWVDGIHRLHSGDLTFKPGYHADLRYNLNEIMSWETAYFRCLHTVFVKRSSLQRNLLTNSRWNPSEVSRKQKSFIKQFKKKYQFKGSSQMAEFLWKTKLLFRKDWKHEHYREGGLVEKDICAFFPQA